MQFAKMPTFTGLRSRLSRFGNKVINRTTPISTGPCLKPVISDTSCSFHQDPATPFSDKSPSASRSENVEAADDIRLTQTDPAWFSRRKSSLKRLSAKLMAFKEETRYPRNKPTPAFAPLVLDVEEDTGFFTTVMTMELMSFTSLHSIETNPWQSRDRLASECTKKKGWSFASLSSACPSPKEKPSSSLPCHQSTRSSPVNVRRRRAFQAKGACFLSETPLTNLDLQGMYGETPDTARTCRDIAFYRGRFQSSVSYISYRTARSSLTSFVKSWHD